MAKKTKDSNLSIEERLEQALISKRDEPYKLPETWCWTHWGNSGRFVAGGAFKEKYQGQKGLPIPFYKVGSLKYSDRSGYLYDESNTIDEDIRSELKVAVIPVNSIIFAKIGEAIRLNRRSLNEVPCCIDNNLMAFIPSDKCYYKYVYYWSKGIDLYEYANATTVPAIRKTDLESIPFPLAPYETQIKIVERIESLFAKLDEAKESAQEAVDGFETRKAAILHKAFTGELTAKWRDGNGITKESWIPRRINQVCKARAGYAFESKKFTDSGYQVIRMGNLYGGNLDLNRNPVFVSANDVDNSILKRALINDGDILITLTGTKYKRDYGYAVCIRNPNNYLVNQRILCLTPDHNEVTTDFLLFYLQSDLFQDLFFSNETGGVNQGNVSSKFVENIQINVPSYEEQEEIGRVLRNTLDKEHKVKDAAENVIEHIDIIKKAILGRAFRGELGTNDPTDESAVELLKRIVSTQ